MTGAEMNASTYTLNAISDIPNSGWMVTIVIFIGILLALFLISKNFRLFTYGVMINMVLLPLYFYSRWVGKATEVNDLEPLRWTIYVFAFVLGSIVMGIIATQLKAFKEFEKNIARTKRRLK